MSGWQGAARAEEPPARSVAQQRGEARPADRLGIFAPLRNRNYRLYWFGQLPSVLGQNMQFVAVTWLVLQLTDSPLAIGLVGLVQSAPNIAFSFVGGAVADRMDRRRLLARTQALTALLFACLGGLVISGWVTLWHVVVVAFLLGVVRSFDQPSRQGLLPLLVPREEIVRAVPLGNLIWQLARLVGPATAGLLIAWVGVGETYLAASGGFLIALALFSQIHLNQPSSQAPSRGIGHDVLEGLQYLRTDRLSGWLLGMTFFNSVFGLSYTIIMPVIAREVLHVGSQGFGFLEAAGGLGSLAGSFLVAHLAARGSRGRQMLLGAGTFGLLIVAFAYSPYYGLSLALLFFMGAANQVYMTNVNTTLQLHVPDAMRGRVMGLWGLTWSLMPLGGTIAGTIAHFAGPRVALATGGVLVTGMAVLMALLSPRIRRVA